jgi:hypothetical protein
MAFPNDLSDVVVFKIHPAIGIARLARNDDYYVHGNDPGTYKSNALMKRQAVQFKIYAYGENHIGLGELTPTVMGNLKIKAVWSEMRTAASSSGPCRVSRKGRQSLWDRSRQPVCSSLRKPIHFEWSPGRGFRPIRGPIALPTTLATARLRCV